ncbi:MAG TPA: hypothetical protein VH986_01960 [Acidimicrobiia bacterium]|jgi:hypothetical protein
MRTVRVFVACVLAAGVLAVLATDATASAPAKTSSKLKTFCKAAQNISGNTSNDTNSSAAKKLSRTTRAAAKVATTSKVKSALNQMADYYDGIANAGSNPDKLAAALKNVTKYTKAAATFTGYYIANCSFAS